jgi:phosphoenolpyruvate synthase/pyruvate phosphate dikinase
MTAQQIKQLAKYKQKIKDLISIIRYQEGYIDKLDETYVPVSIISILNL